MAIVNETCDVFLDTKGKVQYHKTNESSNTGCIVKVQTKGIEALSNGLFSIHRGSGLKRYEGCERVFLKDGRKKAI